MKRFIFLTVILIAMGLMFMLASCSKGGSKQAELTDQDSTDSLDLDAESWDDGDSFTDCEWTPPYYCKDAIAYIHVRDLPRSKDVDCEAQCNAELKCEWEWANEPTDTTDYQIMLGACITTCGKLGSWDYTAFDNCTDMKKKIEELTMEYVDTSTWKDCQPPKSEGDWTPNPKFPCTTTCEKLLERCPSEMIKILSKGARGEGVTDLQMCFSSCIGKFPPTIADDVVTDAGINLSCEDVECFIKYNCQWPPYQVDGDWETYDEPTYIDYEITP